MTDRRTNYYNAVCLVAALALLAMFSFGQVSFNDFFWHLSLGKWMFATNSFLTHDIFSLAFSGKLWLNNTWVFDGLTYLIFSQWSYVGLGLFRFIIFLSSYWILLKVMLIKKEKSGFLFALSILLFTVPVIRNFLRPEITAPLFIALFLYALYSYKYRASKLVFLLPILEILWTNTHGSFQIGVALISIFFGAELIRSLVRYRSNVFSIFKHNPRILVLLCIGLAAAAATLMNPIGVEIHRFAVDMLADKETLANVQEWAPVPWQLFLTLPINDTLPFILIGWMSLLTLIYKARTLWKMTGTTLRFIENFFFEDVLLFLLLLVSAMQYVRGTHIFTIIAAVIFVKNVSYWPRMYRALSVSVLGSTIVFALCFGFTVYAQHSGLKLNTGPSQFQIAKESIDFVLDNKLSGNYLNEYADGSELIWLLYPHYKVFIDGRSANVYDGRFYWYYRNASNEKIFDILAKQYNLNFAIANNGWNIADTLIKKNWKLVFFDNRESIYVKSSDENKKIIEQHEYTLLSPRTHPDAYVQYCSDPEKKKVLTAEINRNLAELALPLHSMQIIAKLALECDGSREQLGLAERILTSATALQPGRSDFLYNLGVVQLKLDKNKEALTSFKKALARGRTKEVMTGYAIALHNLGDYRGAQKAFDDTLRLQGTFVNEYYQIYGRTLYQLDENARAIDMFRRYLDLAPPEKITAQDYLDLSNAFHDYGMLDQAEEFKHKAEEMDQKKNAS